MEIGCVRVLCVDVAVVAVESVVTPVVPAVVTVCVCDAAAVVGTSDEEVIPTLVVETSVTPVVVSVTTPAQGIRVNFPCIMKRPYVTRDSTRCMLYDCIQKFLI